MRGLRLHFRKIVINVDLLTGKWLIISEVMIITSRVSLIRDVLLLI
jgi:hypothetical protein